MTRNLSIMDQSPPVEVFSSPWRRVGPGKSECLRLSRDDKGNMRAQALTQNLFGKFASFIHGRREFGTDVFHEKVFKDVSQEQFAKERERLQELNAARRSASEMMQELEKEMSVKKEVTQVDQPPPQAPSSLAEDRITELTQQMEALQKTLGQLNGKLPASSQPDQTEEEIIPPPPSLSAAEISDRQALLKQLRDQLSEIVAEIQAEEEKLNARGYQSLLSTIQRTKSSAQQALLELSELDAQALNPNIPSEELRSSSKRIMKDHTHWHKELSNVRQARVEETSLDDKAAAIADKLQSFSQTIQDSWNQTLQNWQVQVKDATFSLQEVHAHGKALEEAISTTASRCRAEILDKLQTARRSWETQIGKLSPGKFPMNLKAQEGNIRTKISQMRLQVWQNLENEQARVGNNFDAIIAWKQHVADAEAFDATLLNALTRKVSSNWWDRAWDYVPYFKESSSEEVFDELVSDYTLQILAEIGSLGRSILESIYIPEQTNLSEHFEKMVAKRPIISQIDLKEMLDLFIKNVKAGSQSPALEQQCEQIQHLYACLETIFSCHQIVRDAQVQEIDRQRKELLAVSNHSSMQELSQEFLEEFRKDLSWDPHFDLGVLRDQCASWRNRYRKELSRFAILKGIAATQAKYIVFETTYRAKVPALTGKELLDGQACLRAISSSLDFRSFLKERPFDEKAVTAYTEHLQQKQFALQQVFDIEAKKENLRKAIKEDIQQFVNSLKSYHNNLVDLEKAFAIQLKNEHAMLDTKEKEILVWQETGRLESSRLFSVFSYKVKLSEVSLNDLPYYRETLGRTIASERSQLVHGSRIPSCLGAFQDLNNEMKLVEARINELKSAHMQFKHSDELLEKLKEETQNLQKRVKANPILQVIQDSCKQTRRKLVQLLSQYRQIEMLTLLEQLRRFSGNPQKEHLIKQTFIHQVTAKVQGQIASWKDNLDQLREFPGLYNDAFSKIKHIQNDLETHLNVFEVRRGFCASLNPWATTEKLAILSMDYSDLQEYEIAINGIIKIGQRQVTTIEGLIAKVRNANKKFEEHVQKTNDKIEELEGDDQYFDADRLKNELEKMQQKRRAYLESTANPQWRCWRTQHRAVDYLEQYHSNIGNWVSTLEALMRRIDKKIAENGLLSIPQQLERSKSTELSKKLRDRYDVVISNLCAECKSSLKGYSNSLKQSLSHYIPVTSKFFRSLESSIEDKIAKMQSLKEEYKSGGLTGCFSHRKAVSILSPRELRGHLAAVQFASKDLLRKLKDEFPLDNVLSEESRYSNALTQVASKSDELRQSGQYYYALSLDAKIDKIKQGVQNKWKHRVNSAGDLKELAKDLSKAVTEIQVNMDKETAQNDGPLSVEKQLVKMANFKLHKYSDAIKEKYDSDLSALRQKVIYDVRAKMQSYRAQLEQLELDILEIDKRFQIPAISKKSILTAIADCSKKLSHKSEEFSVPFGWTFGYLKGKKKLEEMTASEIADIEPEKEIEEFAKKGLASITSQYSMGLVIANYRLYTQAIKEAQDLSKKLLLEGQILYSIKLKKFVDETEQGLKTRHPSQALVSQGVTPLVSTLSELTNALKTEIYDCEHQPKMDLQHQIDTLPRNVTEMENICQHFGDHIQSKSMETYTILHNMETDVKEFSQSFNLPLEWIKGFSQTTQEYRTKVSDLEREFKRNKVDYFSFLSPIVNRAKLILQKMIDSEKELDKLHKAIEEYVENSGLSIAKDAAKAYSALLVKAQNALRDMRNDGNNAQPLQKALEDQKEAIVQFFKENSAIDFKKLAKQLQKCRAAIRAELDGAKKSHKLDLATYLNSDVSDKEKSEFRAKFVAKQIAKVEKTLGEIKDYRSAVKQLEDLLEDVCERALDHDWQILLGTEIETAKESARVCLQGLPVNNPAPNIKTFVNFGNDDLIAYEKKVRHLTSGKESLLENLEKKTHLKGLIKELQGFQEAKNKAKSLLEDASYNDGDPLSESRKYDLEVVLKVQTDLVARAFSNLAFLSDSNFCKTSISQAKKVLEIVNGLFADKKPIGKGWQGRFDRWTGLKYTIDANSSEGNPDKYKNDDYYRKYKWGILGSGFDFEYSKNSTEGGVMAEVTQTEPQLGLTGILDLVEEWLGLIIANYSGKSERDRNASKDRDDSKRRDPAPVADAAAQNAPDQAILALLNDKQRDIQEEKNKLKQLNGIDNGSVNLDNYGADGRGDGRFGGDEVDKARLLAEKRQRNQSAEGLPILNTYEQILDYRDGVQKLCNQVRESVMLLKPQINNQHPNSIPDFPLNIQWV